MSDEFNDVPGRNGDSYTSPEPPRRERPSKPFSYWELYLSEVGLDTVGQRERKAVVPMVQSWLFARDTGKQRQDQKEADEKKVRYRLYILGAVFAAINIGGAFLGSVVANHSSTPQYIYVVPTPSPTVVISPTPRIP